MAYLLASSSPELDQTASRAVWGSECTSRQGNITATLVQHPTPCIAQPHLHVPKIVPLRNGISAREGGRVEKAAPTACAIPCYILLPPLTAPTLWRSKTVCSLNGHRESNARASAHFPFPTLEKVLSRPQLKGIHC